MKKLIIAATAIAFIGLGGSAASAQVGPPLDDAPDPLPIECSEQDEGATDSDGDGIPDNCVEFYVAQAVQVPALDVGGFVPVCIADAPFVSYSIVPIDFEPTQPIRATLTIRDRNGALVDTLVVNTLTGTFIYPGASVDASGNATDWPGWVQTNTGAWVPDPTDAILREGLVITVEINPTAVANVSYAPATSACADPIQEASLPTTGSGTALPLQIGAILLVAGGLTLVATKRRSSAVAG